MQQWSVQYEREPQMPAQRDPANKKKAAQQRPVAPLRNDLALKKARHALVDGEVTWGHPHWGEMRDSRAFELLDVVNAFEDPDAWVERRPEDKGGFWDPTLGVFVYNLHGESAGLPVLVAFCFRSGPKPEIEVLGVLTAFFEQQRKRRF
jgi:hypothetical protein